MPSVFADNLIISANGWEEIGENEVLFDSNLVNLHTIKNGGGEIILPNGFSLNAVKSYTAEEKANGTFAAERDTALTYDVIDGYAVTYDGQLSAGTQQIPGTIKLKWKKAAKLADGTLCDVTMTVDNITIKVFRPNTKPVSILLSGADKNLEASIFYASQETLNGDGVPTDIGAKYDISFSVNKTGTDELVHKNMIFALQDMDIPDRMFGDADHYADSYKNPDGSIAEFVEGVTLISGITDKLYLKQGYYLNIGPSSYGENTNFGGNKAVDNMINGVLNTEEMRKAGLMTRVNSDGFKFQWHGSGCRSAISGSITSKVITSTSGEHKDHAHITETDEEVFWKEDKKIVMTADTGYIVSKVTVDGEEVKFTRNSDGSVTYVFEDVISDHEIDVQVEPAPIVSVPNTAAFVSKVLIGLAISVILIASITIYFVTKGKKKIAE